MKCDRVTWYFQNTIVYGALFIVDPKIILFFVINWSQALDIQIHPHQISLLKQMNAPNVGINTIRIPHIGALNFGMLINIACVVMFDIIRYVVDVAFREQMKLITVVHKRFHAQMFKIG